MGALSCNWHDSTSAAKAMLCGQGLTHQLTGTGEAALSKYKGDHYYGKSTTLVDSATGYNILTIN